MTLDELKEAVIADLTTELRDDPDFSEALLGSKVAQALREVKSARRYPKEYTEEMISSDMEQYFSNVYNIALYDYNQVGIDFETGHSENGINRQFTDRKKLFYGIIPVAVV